MQPGGMREAVHLRRVLRVVVDALSRDAHRRVRDLYWWGLVVLLVDGRVGGLRGDVRGQLRVEAWVGGYPLGCHADRRDERLSHVHRHGDDIS